MHKQISSQGYAHALKLESQYAMARIGYHSCERLVISDDHSGESKNDLADPNAAPWKAVDPGWLSGLNIAEFT